MARRRFSEREVIATLIHQGFALRCFRCGELFSHADKIEREHLHELKLGGADDPSNCRYSHKDCHAVVTNGAPATTAGSSRHRIAKAFEPTRIEKFAVKKKPLDEPREAKTRFGNTSFARK